MYEPYKVIKDVNNKALKNINKIINKAHKKFRCLKIGTNKYTILGI